MNETEIEILQRRGHTCPNVRKGVRLLYRLMLAVNRQSDGWAYWRPPGRAAGPLMGLLRERAGWLFDEKQGTVTWDELRKVVTPIKRMATVQRKKQAGYGNVFEFDVEAAMLGD
jgi:hypothetical protein